MLVLFLLTWYVTTGADLKEEAGGRRSYNVELVSPDFVGAPGEDLKEEGEGRRQETGGRGQ